MVLQSDSSYFCAVDKLTQVYMKRQKTQNSQLDIEGKEESWRTDTTQPQDLL